MTWVKAVLHFGDIECVSAWTLGIFHLPLTADSTCAEELRVGGSFRAFTLYGGSMGSLGL